METSTAGFKQLAASSKQFARRLLTIGENRLELLAVEVQEEREHLLRTLFLAFGAAVFGLLAGLALTAAITIWLWAWSPVAVLLSLAGVYGIAGICFYRRVIAMAGNWQMLSATLGQIQKDRECLEKILK
jgi:uncharacterized membrane protein YqjE